MKFRNYSLRTYLAVIAFLGVVAVLLGMTQRSALPDIPAGAPAPEFSGTTLTGETLKFPETVLGKPSIVLMWSTWCPYCKVLMPRLSKIRDELGVDVIAVNAKERGIGDPEAYMREAGYDFTTILDGDEIAASFGVEYLPGLFVVSPTGSVVYRRGWTDLNPGQTVADLWEQQVVEAVQSLMGGSTD